MKVYVIFGEYENTRPPPPPKSLISDSKYINSMKKHICETLCSLNNQHITDVWMMEILVIWDSKIHKKQYAKAIANKHTLTGMMNCKKTARHHVNLSLCAKSRKTNDAKSRKWQKPQFGQFFGDL